MKKYIFRYIGYVCKIMDNWYIIILIRYCLRESEFMREELILVKPSRDYLEQIYEYRQEFLDNDDSMDGTSSLRRFENIEEWLQWVDKNENEETCAKEFVPSSQFLTIRKSDNRLVGMVNIRHRLNDNLLKFGGHIGYSIRKSEREKGYAKEQLRLALLEAKKLKINKVLITCNKDNFPSRNTILSANGVLENELIDGEGITQRYWINNEGI